MLKTLLGLSLISTVYYKKKLIEKPKAFHHPHHKDSAFIQNNLLLKKPFAVTPWLINPHLQIIYHSIKTPKTLDNLNFKLENLTMPDGAMTQLFWLNADLPADTPTIVLVHTITGSPYSMKGMLEDLSKFTGWRVVMCLRRGHTLEPQPFSTINLMGSVPDFKFQIAHIQKRYPNSDLYAVGSSAGTALLARYLGEVAENTPFKSAFAYAPGYDLEIAFNRIAPFYDWYMAKKVKRVFFLPHQNDLMHRPEYQPMLKVKRLRDLQPALYQFAGFSSYEEYLKACNPIQVFANIAIPTMVLNAEDDPICHIDNARQYLSIIENNPNLTLITTKHGSHCMHYQGFKPRSWSHQLIAEYLLHCHHTHTHPNC